MHSIEQNVQVSLLPLEEGRQQKMNSVTAAGLIIINFMNDLTEHKLSKHYKL